jgi:hypothetical protein
MSCPRHRYGQVAEAHEDPTHPAHTGASGAQPAHNHAAENHAAQQPAPRRSRSADEPAVTPKGNVHLK